MQEKTILGASATTGLITRPSTIEVIDAPHFTYNLSCVGPDGEIKWEDVIHNLVTTEGRANLLNVYFGSTAKPTAWYLGLISASTTGPVVGDTLASHAGWTESVAGTDYSGTRRTLAFTNTATGSIQATQVSFAMTGTVTINGCFSATAQSSNSGILYSAGTFSPRPVSANDTLNVTLTLSLTAA